MEEEDGKRYVPRHIGKSNYTFLKPDHLKEGPDPFSSEGSSDYLEIPRHVFGMIKETARDSTERYNLLSREGKIIHFLAILIVTLILSTFFADLSPYYTESNKWQEERIFEFEEDTIIPDPFCFQIDSEGNYHYVYLPLHESSWNSTIDGMRDTGHYRYVKITQSGDILYNGKFRDVRYLENLPVIMDNGSYLSLDNGYCVDSDNNIYHAFTGYNSILKGPAIVLAKWDSNGTILFLRYISMPWDYDRFFHEEISRIISNDGHIMGVFIYQYTIHFIKITTDGRLLQAEKIDPRPGVFLTRFPNGVDIAENSKGQIYLVWNVCIRYDDEWDLSYDAIILAKFSPNHTVVESQRITYNQNTIDYPAIAIDDSDEVHVQCVVPDSYSPRHFGGFLSVRESTDTEESEFNYYHIIVALTILVWISHFIVISMIMLWKKHPYMSKTYLTCLLLLFALTLIPITIELEDPTGEINAYPDFGDSSPFLDLFIILFIFLIALLLIKIVTVANQDRSEPSNIAHEDDRGTKAKASHMIKLREPGSGFSMKQLRGWLKKSSTWLIIIQSIIIMIILVLPLEFAEDIRFQPYASGESIFIENRTNENQTFSCSERIRHNLTNNSTDSKLYDFPIWKDALNFNVQLKGDHISQKREDNIDLFLYDPDGDIILTSQSNDTNESFELLQDEIPQIGTYSLEVRWVHSHETVNYTLTIRADYPFDH